MDDPNSEKTFWKKNARSVPGRPSPKKTTSKPSGRTKTSGTTSFQDFQASVSDVWDVGDDEYMNISDTATISKKLSESVALNVLNCHRSMSGTTANDRASDHNAKPASIHYSNATAVISDMNSGTTTPSSVNTAPVTTAIPSPPFSNSAITTTTMTTAHLPSNILDNESSTTTRCRIPGRPLPLRGTALNNYHQQQQNVNTDDDCESKRERFEALVSISHTFAELCELSWSGIPVRVRPITWRLLSGYLPVNLERRQGVLEQKRANYWNLVAQYYDCDREQYQETYHQIIIDVPRMNPQMPIFQQQLVQKMFERILFIWAIRHPASGYVQGINDLVTPFYFVFLQEVLSANGCDEPFETANLAALTAEQRDIIEADSYWCLSKFLDGIQDNYVFAQPAIQMKVNQLKELIQRVDCTLHNHLIHHHIDYLQFSFRWLNNLLTRELPLRCTIRLWDTYLAESDSFASFQLYVCAAFLLYWKSLIMEENDFQGLMLLLQNLPTTNWNGSHISLLVAEAYRLKALFADAPNHLLQPNQKQRSIVS